MLTRSKNVREKAILQRKTELLVCFYLSKCFRRLTQTVWDVEIILKHAREGRTIELQRRYSHRYHDRHFDKPSLICAGQRQLANSQQNHNSLDYWMSLDTVVA